MFIRSFSITGALLLGAAPLVAQTPPGPVATAKGVVDPNTPDKPTPAPLSGKPVHKPLRPTAHHGMSSTHADGTMHNSKPTEPSRPK